MTTATRKLISQGHEYAELAGTATSPGMALVYLRKAKDRYQDGGRADLVELIEGMMERIG